VLAYATARRLGRWAPRTRFVELYINRGYRGIYVLSEQVKLDAARVSVARAGISGGYVVEGSATPFADGFQGPASGWFYGHKDPKFKQLRSDEAGWIAGYVAAAELSLAARNGSWRAFVDEPAAVGYLLLQELFTNLDAYSRSTFLAKGTDQPLVFGPVWDFDWSMGLDLSGGFSVAPQGWVSRGRPLARDLLADPAFTQRLVARWSQLRSKDLLRSMLRQLDHTRRVLRAPRYATHAAGTRPGRARTHRRCAGCAAGSSTASAGLTRTSRHSALEPDCVRGHAVRLAHLQRPLSHGWARAASGRVHMGLTGS